MIIILLMAIHLSTCYLYAIVSSNYFDEDTSFFWFNYWMPPVDLNDHSTPYYEDSQTNQYLKSFYYAFLSITGNDIAP